MKRAVSVLLVAVLSLLTLGLVMMASIEGHPSKFGPERTKITNSLVRNQMLEAGIGLVLMWAVSCIDYRRWRPLAGPLLSIVFVLLVLVLIPGIGLARLGARRELSFVPFLYFRPSDLAGLALVLFMVWWYSSENPRALNLFWVPVAVMYGLGELVFVEPDFSMALLVLLTGWVMMILGKARYDHIAISILIPVTGLMWAIANNPYSRARLVCFFTPEYNTGPAYLPTFVLALKSGGWSGVGLGNGHWTDCFLPETFTGLVTAAIGEELGLVALLIMSGMFAAMIVSGAYIAAKAPDRFGTLLGTGIVALLAIQVLLNLVSVTWLLPIKAVLLPLVSHGGLSLCVTLTGVGVLLNIASEAKQESMACAGS